MEPRVLALRPNGRAVAGVPRAPRSMGVDDLLRVWDFGVDTSSPGWLLVSGGGEEVTKALDALMLEPLGPPQPFRGDDHVSVARVRVSRGLRQVTDADVEALRRAMSDG